MSPTLPDSLNDSVIANMGLSREKSNTPSEAVVVAQPVGDALSGEMDVEALTDSPLPDVEGQLSDLPLTPVAASPQGVTNHGSRRSAGRVPRCRLAREGPFLTERSSSALRLFGAGCAFRNTTYRASDYASPSGEFGIPLNLPRFLEWIGIPESAGLLEMGPGRWLNVLSRDKAMDAAIQLHRDVCLMTTNLDILDQYALLLQGTTSKMLEMSLGSSDFPLADVAAGALGSRVRRVSVQMEAMGLWRPSLDPILLAL